MKKSAVNILSGYLTLKTILLIGFLTHLSSAIIVYAVGYLEKIPSQINKSGALYNDGILYFEACRVLAEKIGNGDLSDFLSNEQLHVKLYSIFYFIFSPIFGNNILCFEPLSITLFLLVLFFVYKIGKICFDSKVGLLTALLISFSPTFLLHATQPLRDLLFVLLFLMATYFLLILLEHSYDLKKQIGLHAICYVLILLTWIVRDSAFAVYTAAVFICLILFILKSRKTFQKYLKEIVVFVCFFILVLQIPGFFPFLLTKKIEFTPEQMKASQDFHNEMTVKEYPQSIKIINGIRNSFIVQQPDAGSIIDRDVVFTSTEDVLLYSPRAALIGLFAPFPNMWFEQGKSYGKASRLISSFETLVFYFLSFFSLFTLYYHYKSFKFWQLFLTVIVSTSGLGLLVTNIGALYRIRYVFWFLMMILGLKGTLILADLLRKKNQKDLLL